MPILFFGRLPLPINIKIRRQLLLIEFLIKNIELIRLSNINTNLDYAVFIDLDNVYRGLIDNLDLKINPQSKEEKPTKFQLLILKEMLRCVLKSLSYTEKEKARYIKAFAEYDNLPFQNIFQTNVPAFLYNLGIKPINPFTAYSNKGRKKKNTNASDVALTLEVVSDILVKNVPIKLIIIVSGDIDFYPLVSWIKEYTNKEVLILSFKNRLNPIYKELIDFHTHLANNNEILTYLDKSLRYCLENIVKIIFENQYCLLKLNNEFIFLTQKDIDWLVHNINKLITDNKEKLINLININREKLQTINSFIQNIVDGIKIWLNEHNYISTNLIIENWLPKWNLNISEKEANICLKNLKPYLEKLGYKFEEKEFDNKLIGKFIKI